MGRSRELSELASAYDGGSLGFRNRIINGDMRIDQRNAGASVSPPNQGYCLDRWTTWLSQATYTVQRNAGGVTPPPGFSNYHGVTVTSATTIGVGDYFGVGQKIEGFNISDLAWGTASAQAATLSFWVRSSLTGNFGAVIRRGDGGQYYAFTYAISAANTWEYKTITVPGPTSGTWSSDNGIGLFLLFGLGAGSNQTASSNNTWINGGVLGASGATPVVATNGATFYITGVQLEAGSVATPFERRDYGRELMMCQRYYQRYSYDSKGVPTLVRITASINEYDGSMPIPTMRASPTFTTTSTQVHKPGVRSESFTTGVYTGPTFIALDITPATNDSTSYAAFLRDGSIALTAEL